MDENIRLLPKERKEWPHCILARRILIFMSFLGFLNLYVLRVNLSVALVCMVNSSMDLHNQTESLECPIDGSNNTEDTQNGEFYWDSNLKGIILGSFFYGYVITQLPGGRLAELFGGKWVYGVGIFATSILTLLTPIASRFHVSALITLRILEGLFEGIVYPAMHVLLAQWIPRTERSSAAGLIFSGSQIGAVIAFLISGILCDSNIFGGWPSVFYIFGGIACVWFPFWVYFVHSTPEEHPRISREELMYIQINLKNEKSQKKPTLPWQSILTSVPVWALIFCNIADNFGFYILLTELPTFLSTILHFDIAKNGFVSSLPYLVQAIFKWIAGYTADFVYTRHYATSNTIRKVWASIALLGPAFCLLGVGLAGCNKLLNVTLVILAMGLNGFNAAGSSVTHLDMAPEFAGTLLGMTNTAGAIPGFIAPTIVGAMTYEQPTLKRWSYIYFMAACVYVVGMVIFCMFGSARLQPWAFRIEHKEHISKDVCSKSSINTAAYKNNSISSTDEIIISEAIE